MYSEAFSCYVLKPDFVSWLTDSIECLGARRVAVRIRKARKACDLRERAIREFLRGNRGDALRLGVFALILSPRCFGDRDLMGMIKKAILAD